MSKHFISISVAALALAIGSPVLAADATVATSVPVSYSDLDVSSEAGAKLLMTRIERAAQAACGQAPYILDVESNAAYATCVHDAVAGAVANSGVPALTAQASPSLTVAQK